MPKAFRWSVRIAALVQLCTAVLAFQNSQSGAVQIQPRVHAAEAAKRDTPEPLLRVDSSLVLIPVHVTSYFGATVTDLKKDDFAIFQDGIQQTITHFAKDDAPVSVGVLLDISGSMKYKMAKASQAAAEIFQFAGPGDEFFLVEFNARPKVTIPFTPDWGEVAAKIGGAKPSGLTAMLDAIHLGIGQMKHARNARKVLIILSDGGDNFSRRTMRQLRAALIEADVQVYAMGIFDTTQQGKISREERGGPDLLGEVALDSGGRDFPIGREGDLSEIGVQIARQMRNQYILGYSPDPLAVDGKYHQVNLKLTSHSSDLRTYYRRGYYAPVQ